MEYLENEKHRRFQVSPLLFSLFLKKRNRQRSEVESRLTSSSLDNSLLEILFKCTARAGKTGSKMLMALSGVMEERVAFGVSFDLMGRKIGLFLAAKMTLIFDDRSSRRNLSRGNWICKYLDWV